MTGVGLAELCADAGQPGENAAKRQMHKRVDLSEQGGMGTLQDDMLAL